jgi:TolA-binding protein
MHKFRFFILSLLLALSLSLGACSKPENKIGGHLEKMTEIMNDNASSPADGIDELREYLHSNLPDMAEQLGKLIVELEGMDDEAEIKERTKQMAENLKEPMQAFQKATDEFMKKAGSDEKAQKKLAEVTEKWMSLVDPNMLKMMGM